MYTHWQASLRSGVGLGAALLFAIFSFAGPITAESTFHRAQLALGIILGACLCTLIVTAAFRIGLRFCGRSHVGLSVVILTPVLYVAALAPLALVRFQTHAEIVDAVTARDALIHNVVVPGILFLATCLLLPALIAYGTARIIGGRPSVA